MFPRIITALVASLVAMPAVSAAQQRIYVAQTSPAGLQSFSFNGTDLVREAGLAAKRDMAGLAVTDKFFILGPDVFTPDGTHLPPLAAAGSVMIPSPDRRRLFVTSGADLQVVDIDPASSNFRRRVSIVSGLGGLEAVAGELSPDGTRLYVALNRSISPHAIATIDVSNNGANPTLLATRNVSSVMTSLHQFNVGGSPYLAVGVTGSFQAYPLDGNGVPGTTPSNLAVGASVVARDFAVVNGAEDTLYAVVEERGAPQAGPVDETMREAVYVMGMARNATTGVLSSTILTSTVLSAPGMLPSGGINRLFLSNDADTMFVVDHGRFALSNAFVVALRRNGRNAPTLLDAEPLDPSAEFVVQASSAAMAVPPQVVPGAPTITEVSVDGNAGVPLVNNSAHTVRIRGSGLGDARLIGLRSIAMPFVVVSDTELSFTTASLPPPAGTHPLAVMTSSGAAAIGTLTVANGPTTQPPFVVYGDAPATNQIGVLHAASKTEVVQQFASGPGSTELLVSPDGKLLFGIDNRGNAVSAYALTPNAFDGAGFYERKRVPIARNPQQIVADWTRKRLYVSAIADKRIAVVDVDPLSLSFLTQIDEYLSPGEPSFANPNLAGVRALALTPDGQYLYAGRGDAPWLFIVNTLNPTAAAVVCETIPGGALSRGVRIDGLAFTADGSRLVFSASSDGFARLLSVSPGQCPSGPVSTLAVGGPGSRRVAAHRDNRIFITSGTRILVFDGATASTSPAPLATIEFGSAAGRPSFTPAGDYLFATANGSVNTVDIRAQVDGGNNPRAYQVLSRTFAGASNSTVAVSPGLETPVGGHVIIRPLPGVEITYPEVAVPGHTTVTAMNVSDLPVSSIFRLDRIPVFYEIKSTAEWMGGGPARVCLGYSDDGLAAEDEALLRVLHEENGSTVDRTSSLDTANNVICATVASFSQVIPVTTKRTPMLTWSAPAPITEGTPLSAAQLNAAANTAGTFTYQPDTGTILDAGLRTLTAYFTPSDATLYFDATVSVPLTVVAVVGHMTGGGFTESDAVRHYFEVDVTQDAAGVETGTFQLRRQSGRGRSHSTDRFAASGLTRVLFSDDGAEFSGTGVWNGSSGYAFSVRAVDAGEPGGRDHVAITITAPDGRIVASVAGTLAGGNLQR